jgi:hypothetical protein
MSSSLIVLIVVVVLISIVASALQVKGSGKVCFSYHLAKALFSTAERSFLSVLDQAVGKDYRVFCKVRLADVALVNSGLGKSARQGALNKIAGAAILRECFSQI